MNRTFLSIMALAAVLSLSVLAQQQPPPPPSQQPSEVKVVISGVGGGMAPKLAIAPFVALSSDAETVAAAKTITDVLYDDIAFEREYYMIGKDSTQTVARLSSIDSVTMDPWKELNADGLIVGSVQKTGKGIVVKVKLLQVSSGRQAFGKEYTGSVANPRQYAHTVSDDIHQDQIGIRGVARTKLAFTSDRDAERMMKSVGTRDVKEIYFADYDGFNARRVTRTGTLNVAPAWSPDGQAIAYSSWRPSGQFGTFQDIIVSHIYKGLRQTPANGSPDKQSYLPAWSPDGSKLAFTLSQGGNQEIYVMNADGTGMRRLTTHPDIDTSPTWSPTGTQIAWASGRGGNPQIYIMNADGTGQRKITSEVWADRPTWSRGAFNEIAYAARTGAGFDIKLYDVGSGKISTITDGIGSNESPAFAPNGRHLAFVSTRSGKAQIFLVDRDGTHLRQITREGNNGYPSWSQ